MRGLVFIAGSALLASTAGAAFARSDSVSVLLPAVDPESEHDIERLTRQLDDALVTACYAVTRNPHLRRSVRQSECYREAVSEIRRRDQGSMLVKILPRLEEISGS